MAKKPRIKPGRADSRCHDCRDPITDEHFMVNDDVWEMAGMPSCDGGGDLCVGCIEKRLRRQLKSHDFTDAPLNSGHRASDRLLNRMGLLNKAELKELRKVLPAAANAYVMLKENCDRFLYEKSDVRCTILNVMSRHGWR